MKNIFIIISIVFLPTAIASAQEESYRGGIADGHSLLSKTTFTPSIAASTLYSPFLGGIADGHSLISKTTFTPSVSTLYSPFLGGIADGFSQDSLIAFNPRSYINMYSPFKSGIADGASMDSLIAFNPRSYINMYYPFSGSIGDGASMDSLIDFDPRAYITMYRPFSGGIADGWGTSNAIFYTVPLYTTIFDFHGKQLKDKHHLYWKTGNEKDLLSYEIERSKDLSRFSSIGLVKSEGRAQSKEYHWIDEKPFIGKNYYRIKMNEKDGGASYSTIVLLLQDAKGGNLIVYPNPARQTMFIEIPGGSKSGTIGYSLMDYTGKILKQANYETAPNKLAIDLSGLSAAVYVLNVKWNGDIHSFKIVKTE